jgi:hypothetical protein
LGQNPSLFFQNPARKKNPAGQEYEIPAENNSCRDFLVIPAGISCRAAGKNGPASCQIVMERPNGKYFFLGVFTERMSSFV